jgi:hypothetical protein
VKTRPERYGKFFFRRTKAFLEDFKKQGIEQEPASDDQHHPEQRNPHLMTFHLSRMSQSRIKD